MPPCHMSAGLLPKILSSPRASGRRCGCEGDGVAELFETPDMVALETLGVQAIEVVGPEVTVGPMVAEHMVEDDQDAVGDCHDCFLDAASARHAMEEGS